MQHGNIGMVCESVEQSGDARSVWKDGVPVLKRQVRSQNDGAPGLITRVDDVVEKVSGVVIVGEVAKLVDTE